MSSTVFSSGFMVPLVQPIDQDLRSEVNEKLYSEGSNISINYEGTIAYTNDEEEEEVYGIVFGIVSRVSADSVAEFDVLKKFNIAVDKTRAVPYSCVWYNGNDSDMDMLEIKDFPI